MKKFIRVFAKDKQTIKMINQTNAGFDLIILDLKDFEIFKKRLESYTDEDQISIVWQMKHKRDTFTMYVDCSFGVAEDNMNSTLKVPAIQGKRLHVTCKAVQYYSERQENYKVPFTKEKYKSKKLLDRMLKIAELNTLDI